MHRFQPTSSSSPPVKSSALSTSSRTESSLVVAPELQHLSAEDIDILNAVIQRAGPSATTFFNIFKAYSDVLKERGLDPQEVVYYGKLLKLGTLKGKNWGEKWEIVRAQAESSPTLPTYGSFPSYTDVYQENTLSDKGGLDVTSKTVLQRHRVLPVPTATTRREPHTKLDKVPTVRTVEKPSTMHPRFRSDTKGIPVASDLQAAVLRNIKSTLYPASTDTSDNGDSFSSRVPPSYTTNLDPTLLRPSQGHAREREFLPKDTERKKTVDLDDAWKNIRLEQDEKFADKFREDMLIARCWEMWRQGFLWVTTTNQQVGEARDRLLLERFMKCWQRHVVSRRACEDKLVNQFHKHAVKSFFKTWQAKLKQRQQTAWRNDMRQKMKLIKTKSEIRMKKHAWAKWRQHQLSRAADKHYELRLLVLHHSRWKEKLVHLDSLDMAADHFAEEGHLRILSRSWGRWKETSSLRHDENVMALRVDTRVMANIFDLWRKRLNQARLADAFSGNIVTKNAVHNWRKAINSLKVMDHRAEKYLVRQDESLLRAIIRIWRARMRGRRLEQFRLSLITQHAWKYWKERLAKEIRRKDESAIFFNRTNSRLVSDTFRRWCEGINTHRNAYDCAVAHDDARLCGKIMLLWQLRLRENLQSIKVARWANNFFATRRAWHVWIEVMEERKRQERLKLWNLQGARKLVNVWRRRTRQKQYFKQCECVLQHLVGKRILLSALTHWTNRVIELKSRELDVVHRENVSLLRSAFQKWKSLRRKHIEEVSLLENYLLVKREDLLSRTFHRWLAAKRTAEHRRLTHQRKEAQLRQITITSAWERWRERFREERLRPLEYEVIIQNQKNVMFRALSIWLLKTQSLPALKFHSKSLKEKFFKRWRDVMPNALRAKKARETDRHNTLANHFERWAQAYKTKTTLKAVARAKYLRLPWNASRQPIRSRLAYSEREHITHQTEDAGDDKSETGDAGVVVPLKEPFIPRARIARSSGPRSERSLPRSEHGAFGIRQPSPVRSIASMPDRRSKSPNYVAPLPGPNGGRLWSALRDLGHTRRPRNL
ncbi:hypothetical protein GALMADRAFT_113988 [Galerina marginata CBS 339.88]|uniref:Sfi1 spindle body domain-containing protein n=1 Tax=Galerina marginata (strain CBS 339.88) TaxID=685588 RepID=A0A067TEB4_GALM3|nr:hypothetical protein GALMADRAFT_113988 [Galerina marginata CBS 339.88]